MTLKLFMVLSAGFVASFVAAMCLGLFLRTTLQATGSTGGYFEPEAASIVVLMTVCYTLVHRHFRHPRSH